MKYSLHYNLDSEYLAAAAEIAIPWSRRDEVAELHHTYPDKDLLLEDAVVDPAVIEELNTLSEGKIILALSALNQEDIDYLSAHSIRWMPAFPITTGYELAAVVASGSYAARIDAPLFFDWSYLAEFPNLQLRVIPNVSHYGHLPNIDFYTGSYVLPAGLPQYDDLIDIIEFEGVDKIKEQALYRIYSVDGWGGKVSDIILNFPDEKPLCRLIDDKFTEARMTCRQRCKTGGACRLCEHYMKFADPSLLVEEERS